MLNPFKPTTWGAYLFISTMWRKMTDSMIQMGNLPVYGETIMKLAGFNESSFDVTFLPVNKRLEVNNTIYPVSILKECVQRSSHRVIVDQCPCRQGCGCKEYPKDIGCIYLGDGTKDFDPSIAKHASVEESLAHIDKALAAGLIAGIGMIEVDPLLFGSFTPPKHSLSVCFCCECCCVAHRNGKVWPAEIRKKFMHKVEGLVVEVTDNCVGCGDCVEACPWGAISLQDNQARIDDDLCKGCGLCVENCPAEAISIEITDGERMRKALIERYDKLVDYTTDTGKKVNTEGRDRAPHPRHGFKDVKIKSGRG